MGSDRNSEPLPPNPDHRYGMLTPKQKAKISARLAACREVVSAIRIAADNQSGLDRLELLALAHRIHLCSKPENMFVAFNAHNMETDEHYDATGTHWSCGSKLCPNCLAKFAAKNRYKIRRAINSIKLRHGERWNFATFTIVNPRISLVATRQLVNHAWSLFRKRLLCVSLIRGGAKSEEFTLTTNGYHYHLHVLFVSKWFSYQEMRRTWTECVASAFHEAQIPLVVNNKDGLLSVVVKPVSNLDNVANEVCKYITKSDSWTKMPVEHLAEVGLIRRWHRMFELLGDMSARETSKSDNTLQDIGSETILDTRTLSDGASPSHSESWRIKFAELSFEDYIRHVNEQFWRTISFRKEQIARRWPTARLFDATELQL